MDGYKYKKYLKKVFTPRVDELSGGEGSMKGMRLQIGRQTCIDRLRTLWDLKTEESDLRVNLVDFLKNNGVKRLQILPS